MKAFYAIFLLVFLASCGSDAVVETATPKAPEATVIEQTVDDIESELDDMPEEVMEDTAPDDSSIQDETIVEDEAIVEEEETAMEDSKVELLSAPYTNPAGPVDMQIEYSLDSDGNIASIDVSATTYDLTQFNQGAQAVIGMTPAEASEYTFSGSSLTGPAFNDAMKSAM